MSDLQWLMRIWPHARPDRWVLFFALVVTPIIAVCSLIQPWLIKQIIDLHIVPGRLEGVSSFALLYLAAVMVNYFLEASYTWAIAWGGTRTILRMREALYEHALRLRQSFFDRQPAGKLLTRLTSDLDSLGDALGAGVVTIALDLLMILGTLGAMFWLDWRLTAVLLALLPPLLIVLDLLRRRIKKLFLSIRESLARINAYLAEQVDGVQIVQLFNVERRVQERFEERNREFRNLTSTSNVYDAGMYALVDGASSIFVAAMLVYGSGWLGAQIGWTSAALEPVSAGLLVAFIDYLNRLFRPLRDLSGKIAIIQRATAALQKIHELFDGAELACRGEEPVAEIAGHLVLEDVWFRYREDAEDVLRGVSLEVKPGEVVAVVGATGSGKTTLTRLLDRSYQGYRGSIRLDGRELSLLSVDDLRQHMAAVRQDTQVFSETIRRNVDMGKLGITPERLEEVAGWVHAGGFVSRLGWSHVLQERGADLSVGEGQLLTFARAMAHAPSLVLLDEATASIDSITEKHIQAAIAHILEHCTVIVIAHRLSTIREADRIAVMDAGEIVEQGTHAELISKGGVYAALVAAGESVHGRVEVGG